MRNWLMAIDRSFNQWNWMDAPHNRQAFQHMREFVPTAHIARADRPPSPLPRDLADPSSLDSVSFASRDGSATTWGRHLADSWCDAVCVVHDGRIVDERYFNGMHDRRLHLLMSVSKSFCGAALGVAIGQGRLTIDDLVTDLAPEFHGTSLEGATVRHLVDMTAGTDFVEDYDVYDGVGDPTATPSADPVPLIEYEHQASYRPLGDRVPIGTLGHFRTYATAYPHGAWFHYRSPLTNIVARVLEVVNDLPYAQIVERDLWEPLGMEHDADIMLDPLRNPVVEGGMSCTLRDLARLGIAYLDDGMIDGRQVIPADWVADTRDGDEASVAAFEAQPGGAHDGWSMYRNAFWVMRRGQEFSGIGIFGQYCWVHRPSRTVIARFSTYPTAFPEDVSNETIRGFEAMAEHLASGS
jgi:CubicO group peptidase (beta-lactamase class C family)